jgi:type IV pilus assembly protein PilV
VAERLTRAARIGRRLAPGRGRGERGFTVIEVLIALLVLLLGMAGILSLQLTSIEATGYSRHATEATVLGEARMEELRTSPIAAAASGTEQVDARGVPDPQGLFTRAWQIVPGPSTAVTVRVTWRERGSADADDEHEIALRTVRKR